MKCEVISTGSKGNAVILEDMILLDCGVPYKALAPYKKDLRLVLLTHIHSDHFNPATVRRLHQERPLLRFGCCPWMLQPLLQAGVSAEQIDVYEHFDVTYVYGPSIFIDPVELIHDVENCGYKVSVDGRNAIYATDTATLDGIDAQGYDLYMIEANYREHEIMERIQRKIEAGEFVYEYRAMASHLSREMADAWLAANAVPGSQVVYLHGHTEGGGSDAQ